jgi:CRP/FNR family transcriptional regulator, cyclic AMP receptor protein
MLERLPRERDPLPLVLAVPRGRSIVFQGENVQTMWQVQTGALWSTAVTHQGRWLALDVLGPGDLVGEPGRESAVTVRSLRPCRLRPAVASELPALLAARAARAAGLACDMACLDVRGRLRSRLTDLADRFGTPVPDGTRIGIRLSQEQLAELTGAARESVNRALRSMQRDGQVRVEGRGRYVLSVSTASPESGAGSELGSDPSCNITRLQLAQ